MFADVIDLFLALSLITLTAGLVFWTYKTFFKNL